MKTPSIPLLPPRYRIVELLGEGGMGRVYKVHDSERDGFVALKAVKAPSAADRRRFEAELRTLSRLQHEGVVRLYDSGRAGDEVFFTMEILDGVTLDHLLDRPLPGKAEVRWILSVAVKVLDALEHVHASGVIHRDVKPSNVIVLRSRDGNAGNGTASESDLAALLADQEPAVKLLDFGLARETESAAQRGQAPAGTPLYMSPEQVHGDARESSDVYSVGAMLYHLVTRQPPFTSLTGVLARKPEPRAPSELNAACSPEASRLILDMISREPFERPATAAEAREKVLSLLHPGRSRRADSPRMLAPTFTGRAAELNAMRAFLSRASEGEGTCIRVAGERGSGKTWLLRESGIATVALADFGLHPVRGTFHRDAAVHAGLRGVFAEMISLVKSRRGDEAAGAALGPWGADLLKALGIESDAPPPTAASAAAHVADDGSPPAARLARDGLLDAGARLLCAAAAVQPLFIAIEDVQHAGELELELLGRLARSTRGLRAAIALTYRPESVRSSKALERWLAELDADGAPPAIVLGSLTDGEINCLLERMLHPRGLLAPRLVSTIAARSEGNPLALSRCMEALWERSAIRRNGDTWDLAEECASAEPDWEAAWMQRLAALDRQDVLLLAAACVLGGPADEELIGSVAGDGCNEAQRDRLRSLVRRGLLADGPEGFSPSHEIEEHEASGRSPLATLLEGKADPDVLGDLHLRAGEALLERLGPDADGHLFRIARHFREAGKNEKAADLFLAAARHMSRIFANGRALEAYRSALELSGSPEKASAIHEQVGDLCSRIGDYPAALAHLRSALSCGNASAALLDKIGRVLHRQGELGEALATFTRCLKEHGSDPAARARALFRIGGVDLDRGDLSAAREHLEESLKLYEGLGDLKQTAAVQFSLGVVEKSQNRLEQAVERFECALVSAERSGSLLEAATTLNNLGNLHRTAGDDHKAVECLRKSIEVRERIGDRQGLAICLNNIARVYTYRGDLAASRASTERALRIFEEIGDKKGVLIARCNLGEVVHQLGELEEARELLASCADMASKLNAQRIVETALCNLGALELDRGEYDAAREQLQRSLRTLPEDKPVELRAQVLGLLAAVSLRRHDLERAGDALREALEIARELKLKEKLCALVSQEVRLHVERGEPDRAVAAGKPLLARPAGAEKMGLALLHQEMGRAYRELGPDWADRTERELETSLRAFEGMKSPHHAATARGELAIYWRLLGEEDEAERLFLAAEETFRRLGAPRRVDEIHSLRGSPA